MKLVCAFTLPGLPKTTNGSRGSIHAHAAAQRKWRSLSCQAASKFKPESPFEKVMLVLTRCSVRASDFDNRVISFKAIVDGLKDAKIIKDDSDDVVIEQKYPYKKVKLKDQCVTIEVYSLTSVTD